MDDAEACPRLSGLCISSVGWLLARVPSAPFSGLCFVVGAPARWEASSAVLGAEVEDVISGTHIPEAPLSRDIDSGTSKTVDRGSSLAV